MQEKMGQKSYREIERNQVLCRWEPSGEHRQAKQRGVSGKGVQDPGKGQRRLLGICKRDPGSDKSCVGEEKMGGRAVALKTERGEQEVTPWQGKNHNAGPSGANLKPTKTNK